MPLPPQCESPRGTNLPRSIGKCVRPPGFMAPEYDVAVLCEGSLFFRSFPELVCNASYSAHVGQHGFFARVADREVVFVERNFRDSIR